MNKTLGLAGLATLLATAACAPTNPELVAPAKADPASKPISAPISAQVSLRPKVDILFVIDTSSSMETHQENLKKNIDRFVEAFNAHKELDFHIGVVSVWDSIRFGAGKAVPGAYPLGKLRPLKDPAHPGEAIEGAQFITRSDRFSEILGETLKVGIEPRFVPGTDDQDGGGPEFEETFTPVLPALGDQNAGFYRKDAHLAVIMITDADDSKSSGIQPGGLFEQLVSLKDGHADLVSGYAALALKDCTVDPGLRGPNGEILQPEKILGFVERAGGRSFNLCDADFGGQLKAVGDLIQEKASALVRIRLQDRPEITTLRVSYDGVALETGDGGAWSYDEVYNKVLIHGDHPSIASKPGGKIKIEYVPIDLKRLPQGKVKTLGG